MTLVECNNPMKYCLKFKLSAGYFSCSGGQRVAKQGVAICCHSHFYKGLMQSVTRCSSFIILVKACKDSD